MSLARKGAIIIVCFAVFFLFSRPSEAVIVLEGDEHVLIAAEARDSGSTEDSVPEAKLGTLTVVILPEEAKSAGARWSTDGGATWVSSDESLLVSEGEATVTFQGIIGWNSPEPLSVKVQGDGGASAAGTYTPLTATLRVHIDGPEEARWHLNDGDPRHPGELIEGVLPGDHGLSFSEVDGWLKPQDAEASLTPGGATELSVAYVRTSTITVTIDGPAEAEWSVDGGLGLRSGVSLEGLAPGEHTISFRIIGGWESPKDEAVVLEAGGVLKMTASYAAIGGPVDKKPATISETVEPPETKVALGPVADYSRTISAHAPLSVQGLPHDDALPEIEAAHETPAPVEEKREPDAEPKEGDSIDSDESINLEEGTEEKETPPIEDEDRLVGNPGIEPEEPQAPEENEDDSPPGEAAEPTFALLDFGESENGRIASAISARRRYLDLGEAEHSLIRACVPDPLPPLPSAGVSAEDMAVISDKLSYLITKGAKGDEATPAILASDGFRLATSAGDQTGKFLTVRCTLTVSHSELNSVDPKLAERVKTKIEAGEPISNALLREVRIYKATGEGDAMRMFDLVNCLSSGGFPLDTFFTARVAGSSRDDFFDTRERDAAYVITFRLLLFDGAAHNPDRSVQPLEGGWFIVFDGLKDGTYSDPVILAAPRPKSVQEEKGGGCAARPGGAAAVLLLLPLLLPAIRRTQ